MRLGHDVVPAIDGEGLRVLGLVLGMPKYCGWGWYCMRRGLGLVLRRELGLEPQRLGWYSLRRRSSPRKNLASIAVHVFATCQVHVHVDV